MECIKCGHKSENNKLIKFNERNIFLCSICKKFSPLVEEKEKFEEYINERVNGEEMESFRKFSKKTNNAKGMEKRAKEGYTISKAPVGYFFKNKILEPNPEEKLKVQKIFMDFVNNDISLNQLAKKYGFSVNGVKKILKNFTYLGKVKFSGQIIDGKHEPIISSELFNKVQSKLERIERV